MINTLYVILLRALVLFLLCLACLPIPTVAANPINQNTSLFEIGKKIYREGKLPSGQYLTSVLAGNVKSASHQGACSHCHGRSAMGVSEGGIQIPPISMATLYQSRAALYQQLGEARHHQTTTRPAYTPESFARAIRQGIDSGGRKLNPLMPRYTLSDQHLDALNVYLTSMSTQSGIGVSEDELHFATIVTDNIDPLKREAMLALLKAWFNDKNANVRNETRRASNPPWHKQWRYRAHRQWKLHIWELTGSPSTWKKQLRDYYQQQPVFAVISGMAAGSWAPIHQFCEQTEVPCVLPNTDLPEIAENDFYTLYFSKGLVLEAERLAKYILYTYPHHPKKQHSSPLQAIKITQVYRGDKQGHALSVAFKNAVEHAGEYTIKSHPISTDSQLTHRVGKAVLAGQPDILVLWLSEKDLNALNLPNNSLLQTEKIVLSSSLLMQSHPLFGLLSGPLHKKHWWKKSHIVHPYSLPTKTQSSFVGFNAWLKRKNLQLIDQRLQANTFVAVTLLAKAIKHIMGDFSRDYLIEKIEHGANNTLFTSVYPHLSLARNQRFVSKGCYILGINADNTFSVRSQWLAP